MSLRLNSFSGTNGTAAMAKLDHIKIAVSDWRASRDWYVNNFGFKIEFEVPDGGPHKLGVAAVQDDAGLTIFLEQVSEAAGGCGCVFYFQVDDVDKEYRSLVSKGIRFVETPQKFYWGYGAELTDPDGHIIRIWDERSMKKD
jgi:predicted enzyme related to lactoylglutathione lyase